MAAKPLLYLIDGSSQMYRAYHAPSAREGGLLRNAQGRPTNAVYGFVTMLRKLIADHHAGVHRGVVRSAGPHVSRRSRRRLQGQPRADARRPRRADSARARGVRSARRADPHLRALRSRRRDRHAGDAGGRGRLRRRDRHRRQGLLSARAATASASSTRATKARGTTRPACQRNSASRPIRSSTCWR